MPISSKSNSSVKQVRALRQRKERERTGLFFVEGIRIVAEAIELHAPIELCLMAPDLLTGDFGRGLAERVRETGAPCLELTGEVFRSLALKDNPQGIGAVIHQHWENLDSIQPADELCWVALDSVQDPGNLGTILRTSDAVGGAGVILLGQSTDPHDPSSLRASMGAVFSQRLVRADAGSFEEWKRRHSALVVGTSDAAAEDYRHVDYRPPLVLLMGSEREGLSPDLQRLCDRMARIPMIGRSDSLNLAVATGVMLYEIFRSANRDS